MPINTNQNMKNISENLIVEENLRRMTGTGEGDMQSSIDPESIGGNAGKLGNMPCYAKRFFYNQSSGQIMYFGNYQFVPSEIRDKFPEGAFIIALNIKEAKERIISCTSFHGEQIAYKNLEETIRIYNERYGF